MCSLRAWETGCSFWRYPERPLTRPRRAISERGITLIQHFEARILRAYKDVNGVWTLGYGWTHGVQAGDEWTPEQAEWMLRIGLWGYENGIDDALGDTPTTQSQFDAMVSLAYNIGVERAAVSSVVKFHRKGRYRQAAQAFMAWTRAGKRVYPGLVRRRKTERVMYLSEIEINEEARKPARHRVVYFRGRRNCYKHYHRHC